MTGAAGRQVVIGVDFDNTIVCYDRVFHAAAVERRLIPEDLPARKDAVRDALRACGREEEWTRLQGFVYGPGMSEAAPFPGAIQFFDRCASESLPAVIISHRTRWPYVGPRYDLHSAAREWLERSGLRAPMSLELTKQDKLARIAAAKCTHFIDDLPEFLTEAGLPDRLERLLFDPHRAGGELPPGIRRMASWDEITRLLVAE